MHMFTSNHSQGFVIGVISAIVFVILVASNSLQIDPNLEKRVAALEDRVTKLEQSNSMDVESRPSESKPANNWRRLENGMTMDQVRSILGEPERVTNFGSLVMWEYGRGSVNFRNRKVDGWREPF